MSITRIPIKDKCGDVMKLEDLRGTLNQIPNIGEKRHPRPAVPK